MGVPASPLLHAVAEAFERRWMSYVLPPGLQGLVISPGGVASTMMIEHLGQFITVNAPDDSDGLKHRPHPPRATDNAVPALVLVGDPAAVARSLAARDFHYAQCIRLGAIGGVLTAHGGGAPRVANTMRRLRRNWERDWPKTLVIDYEEMWDRKHDIAEHFGIVHPHFVEEFPVRRERTSTYRVHHSA